MRPFIEVGDVSFWYETDPPPKDQWVLKEVQLTVARGEYVAIMGPNGSGKSTLARLMNGLLLPKEGKVRIGGYNTDDETHLWQVRQRVGMVFQNPDNQLVATTVRDEIAFGMENLGVPREEMVRRIPEVLAQVGLEGMEEWPPHLLSGDKSSVSPSLPYWRCDQRRLCWTKRRRCWTPQGGRLCWIFCIGCIEKG